MGSILIILTIIIATIYRVDSETIQKSEEIPILDSNIEQPEIRSPYLFSTKQMNLEAIGNNLNPQILIQQKQIKTNSKRTKNILQPIQKQSFIQINQQNNRSQVSNEQNGSLIVSSSKYLTQNKSRGSLLTKNQQLKLEKIQFQKIDLKKLMYEIQKEQKTKKINKRKQPQITYQALFGPIKNEQNDNNKSTQKVIQKEYNRQSQKRGRNKGQFKHISNDKQQILFKQDQRKQKQLDFRSDTATLNQKQLNSPLLDKQKVISSQKSYKQQGENINNKMETSQLIQKQDYEYKYVKIQQQMKQLKKKCRLQQQMPSSIADESIKRESDQTQFIFCINMKAFVVLTATVLLLVLCFLSKKRNSSRIEHRYSLQDDQKIPSEDTD